MKAVFIYLIFLFCLCLGEETKIKVLDSKECFEFLKIGTYTMSEGINKVDSQFVVDATLGGHKYLKAPSSIGTGFCFCYEIAVCEKSKLDFCTFYFCSNGAMVSLKSYIEAIDGDLSFGNEGQPIGTK